MSDLYIPQRPTVLPPNSTNLEKAVDDFAPRWDDLAQCVRPLDGSLPEPFKPWLAAEWTLAEFAPYFDDVDALLAAGIPWLRLRGSPAAVRMVLDWLGFTQATIEEDGAYLHVGLARRASDAEVRQLAHVVRASIPAHVHFWRIFHGWDLRPIRLDVGPPLDVGLLDNDSGVWMDTDGDGVGDIKVSQAVYAGCTLPQFPRQQPHTLVRSLRGVNVERHDDLRLDAWRLDSEYISAGAYTGHRFSVGSTLPAVPPPGLPQVVVALVVTTTLPAWAAAGPQPTYRTDARAATAPQPWPQCGWQGKWDARTWRWPLESSNIKEIT